MGYVMVDRDEPLENERELWAVGTIKLPRILLFNKEAKRLVEFMRTVDGLAGVNINDKATLWIFETENHAIRARNLMRAEGFAVSRNIGKVFVPK